MTVGLPGVGKSTYFENNFKDQDIAYVSTDMFIDQMAAKSGKTYSELFSATVKLAEKSMYNALGQALENGQDIFWDQTNMSNKVRMKKLAKIPKDYRKVALVFSTDDETLKQRLDNRPDKVIPDSAIASMKSSYSVPTTQEGFDEIKMVST